LKNRLPDLPDAKIVEIEGHGVPLGGYLISSQGADSPAAAVLLLHGHGVDALDMAEPARLLSQAGYTAFSLSMRGWRGSGGVDDCGLRQADDAVIALEWLSHLPQVNKERIGIVGTSQGGQVALLAGAKTRLLKAIVAHKPVTDIDQWERTTSHPDIPAYIAMICNPESRLRSPVDHAAAINAPVLLIHGSVDTRVPTQQSVLMKEALLRASKQVELKLIEGATHSFGIEGVKRAWRWTLEFFARYLKE
jgi:dipeptidyl aminopeptidase/acylaminoacyl peptidase